MIIAGCVATSDNNMMLNSNENNVKNISPGQLESMMSDEDIFLIDVHTPEQEHISGTDAVIPYDQLKDRLDELPQDKNAKIVVYCRSGSMSAEAAQTLSEAGYTHVYDVMGGRNEWMQTMNHMAEN